MEWEEIVEEEPAGGTLVPPATVESLEMAEGRKRKVQGGIQKVFEELDEREGAEADIVTEWCAQAADLMEILVQDGTTEGREKREEALDELLVGFRFLIEGKKRKTELTWEKMGLRKFLWENAKRTAKREAKRLKREIEEGKKEGQKALEKMRAEWARTAQEAEEIERRYLEEAEVEMLDWAAASVVEGTQLDLPGLGAGEVLVTPQSKVSMQGQGVLPSATGCQEAREFEPFRIGDINRMMDLLRGDEAQMVMPYTIKDLVKFMPVFLRVMILGFW